MNTTIKERGTLIESFHLSGHTFRFRGRIGVSPFRVLNTPVHVVDEQSSCFCSFFCLIGTEEHGNERVQLYGCGSLALFSALCGVS